MYCFVFRLVVFGLYLWAATTVTLSRCQDEESATALVSYHVSTTTSSTPYIGEGARKTRSTDTTKHVVLHCIPEGEGKFYLFVFRRTERKAQNGL